MSKMTTGSGWMSREDFERRVTQGTEAPGTMSPGTSVDLSPPL